MDHSKRGEKYSVGIYSKSLQKYLLIDWYIKCFEGNRGIKINSKYLSFVGSGQIK